MDGRGTHNFLRALPGAAPSLRRSNARMEGEMVAVEVAEIFVGLDSVRRVANFRPVAALRNR